MQSEISEGAQVVRVHVFHNILDLNASDREETPGKYVDIAVIVLLLLLLLLALALFLVLVLVLGGHSEPGPGLLDLLQSPCNSIYDSNNGLECSRRISRQKWRNFYHQCFESSAPPRRAG